MTESHDRGTAGKTKRADARRNEQTLVETAAAVFVSDGVNVPIREIARRAGVGTATIYRHFPTRADLIMAVYRQQVETLAESAPALLRVGPSPYAALERWFDGFVDFVATKIGLAAALQSDDPRYDPLHAYFLERLEPVCARLLAEAAASGEIHGEQDPFELMRGVGGICGGAGHPRYDPRRLVRLLIAGLRRAPSDAVVRSGTR